MPAFQSAISLFLFLAVLLSCSDNGPDEPGTQSTCADQINPDTLQVPSNQMKGWEVYAWPGCGDWNYALLYGTNSLKTYNEVTSAQAGGRRVIKVWSTEKMKRVLARIPAGHTVSLIGDQWLQQVWGAGTYGDLRLPPSQITNELQRAAVQAALDFQLVN